MRELLFVALFLLVSCLTASSAAASVCKIVVASIGTSNFYKGSPSGEEGCLWCHDTSLTGNANAQL